MASNKSSSNNRNNIKPPTNLQSFLQRWDNFLFSLAHYPHASVSPHSHLRNCVEYESTKVFATLIRGSHLRKLGYGDSLDDAKAKVLQNPLNSMLFDYYK